MTYEQLTDMYEPGDPKLWSMLDWENDSLPDLSEADLYPDVDVSAGVKASSDAPVSTGDSE